MASDDSDHFEYSDNELDEKKHEKLVEDVLNLNKIQQLKKPSRTEPSLNISEFDLVKSVTGNKGSVHINELTKALKAQKKHQQIGKKIVATHRKNVTLPTPLEKPQADKIRRVVAYQKNRLDFDRWEAFVTSNRAATNVSFPLVNGSDVKLELKQAENFPNAWRLKSDLQKELEQLEKVETFHIKQAEDEFPLTMKELLEKRQEAAKLRAHQSYKESKARRQSKIKSKKFHRIQRREKVKSQLKEFEKLQKTNPEAALQKLEEIEKARVEERFSLRHKGTGKWARNKQIRAKYDKESRQVLSEQLTISRDLTQKTKKTDSDESEDEGIGREENSLKNIDSKNPWIGKGLKPEKEISDFVSGYRKFWNEQNEKLKEDSKKEENEKEIMENLEENHDKEERKLVEENIEDEEDEHLDVFKKELSKFDNNEVISSKNNAKNKKDKVKLEKETLKVKKTKKKQKSKKEKLKKPSSSTSDWEVSFEKSSNDVEDLFDKLEDRLESKMKAKLKKIQSNKGIKVKKINKNEPKSKKVELTMMKKVRNADIDEQLHESTGETTEGPENNEINALKSILNSVDQETKKQNKDIDPNKFIKPKTTILDTAVPDMQTAEDDIENSNQRKMIMEAFEDDDIVQDFHKEKKDEINQEKPKDIDLSLPGWGDWGGKGIDVNKRKRRRFCIKMPAKIPRRDDNKGSLIINEKAQSKIKELMVSELPFPFKTVKDYEASLRAPIGNTFVPETAFKKLTQPAVTTKMGTIIEPITKDLLIGRKRK